jgi:dihydroorotate dehydrogenase
LLFQQSTVDWQENPSTLYRSGESERPNELGHGLFTLLPLRNIHRFVNLLKSSSDSRLGEIIVIGVGGVTSPEAATRMLKVGATLVACATALGSHGVSIFETLSAAFDGAA